MSARVLALTIAGCVLQSSSVAPSPDGVAKPAREYVQTALGQTVFLHESSSYPKIRNRVEPGYPEEALAKREQGTVLLRTLIDPSGNVVQVTV
ncbi:MAG TPA: energy transducer TonB, partial [Thermoanaerobaculia bacterium]|nr:energy transducer TonB [Thermoanaerobaculia bacterium]